MPTLTIFYSVPRYGWIRRLRRFSSISFSLIYCNTHCFLLLNRERFTILYQQFQAKSNECIQYVRLRCAREEEERRQRKRLEAERRRAEEARRQAYLEEQRRQQEQLRQKRALEEARRQAERERARQREEARRQAELAERRRQQEQEQHRLELEEERRKAARERHRLMKIRTQCSCPSPFAPNSERVCIYGNSHGYPRCWTCSMTYCSCVKCDKCFCRDLSDSDSSESDSDSSSD